MDYRLIVLSLSCLLLLSCEQKSSPSINKPTGQSPVIKDSLTSTISEIDSPTDEDWFTEPQFSMDSLYAHLKWPDAAKQVDGEFRVLVRALVDTNGKPSETIITESDFHLFNQAAIDAVMQTRFTPAYNKDTRKPVAVWITIPIDFTIR
jgi:TonB family protein